MYLRARVCMHTCAHTHSESLKVLEQKCVCSHVGVGGGERMQNQIIFGESGDSCENIYTITEISLSI